MAELRRETVLLQGAVYFSTPKKWVHLLYLKKIYPFYPKYPFWLGCSCCVARTGPPLGFVLCHIPSFHPCRVVCRRPELARILPSRSPKGSLHGQPLESHVFLLARKTQTVLKQHRKGEGGRDVNPKDDGVCRVRAPRGSPDEAPGVRARFGLIFSSVSKEVGQLGSSVLLVAHHASSTSTRKGRLEDAHEGKRGDFLQDSLFFPVEHHAW